MPLRYVTTSGAALLAALALGSVAMANGGSPPASGPSGGPCVRPHPVCQIVKGKQVCTTPPPAPNCPGG